VTVYSPPKPLMTTVGLRHIFAYRSASAGSTNLSRSDLLNLMVLPYSNAPATAYRLIASVRLIKVEAWFIPTATYNSDSFTLRWVSENGPERNVLEPVIGSALPSRAVYTPPRNCFAYDWNHSGYNESQNLATMVFPNGTFLEITVDISLNETDSVGATSITGYGMAGFGSVLGRVGAQYLEGPASSTWVPQGITGLN